MALCGKKDNECKCNRQAGHEGEHRCHCGWIIPRPKFERD